MAVVINSTTGEIDLDQTTPGIYVVTYTVQGVSSTQDVTVNAVDDATFSYSASSYAPTDSDPTPTITGLTGGTFSAGSGLVFVDSGTNTGSSTGEIDLSASTIASYTVTYSTSSSGSSVCPNTSTQTVEIAAAGIANNYSMDFDGSSDYIDANTTVASNLDFSVSTWIKPNSYLDNMPILGTRGLASASTSNGITMNINSSGNLWGRIFTETSNIIQVQTGSTISLNNWSHVAITYNSSSKTLKTYLNGSEVGSIVGTDPSVASTADLNIGRASVGTLYGYFDGKIDEVAIWDTALTSTQVSEIYNATGTNLTKDLTTVSGSNLIYWNRMGD